MRSNHLNEIMTVDNPNALSHVPGPAELIRVKTVPTCRGYPGTSGESLFLLKMLLGQATF